MEIWQSGSSDDDKQKILNDSGPYHRKIWKGKVLAKIKIFLWLIMNNAILTTDNLLKRRWVGDPTCHFCDQSENLSHLFFKCSTAKAVWAIGAKCIGANNVRRSLGQCLLWCENGFLLVNSFILLE